MPKVIIASTNPVKIEATKRGFARMFPATDFTYVGVSVPSQVSDQPMSAHETFTGAMNRARGALETAHHADYAVGIEGGVGDEQNELAVFAWVVILGRDGRTGKAQTGVFYLPQEVARLVRGGMELGHADDAIFGRANSKQQNGSIGLLTDDALDRTEYYAQPVIMALIPFKNTTLTW